MPRDSEGLSNSRAPTPTSTARLLAADPFVRLAGVLFALALLQAPLLRLFSGAEQSDFSRWNDVLLLVLAIGAQHLGRRIEHRELRRHGRLLTVGLAFWLSAHLLYFAAGGWDDPWVSAGGDLLYVLYYLCMLAITLGRPHLPSGWSTGDSSYRFGLASGTVVLLFFFTYFVLPPLLLGAQDAPQIALSELLFVALDILLLGRFLALAVHMRATYWRDIYGLLALAWTIWTTVDVLDLLRFTGLGVEYSETWGMLLQSIAFAAIVGEARIRAAWQLPGKPSRPPRASSSWNEISPLLAIVFVLPAMHFALHRSGFLSDELQAAREVLLVGFVFGLGLLTTVYQFRLERRAKRLAAELLAVGEELEQIRKLEAVGRVAGRAAHGFNNLLTVIQGNAELLQQRLAERGLTSADVVEIAEIETATRQAAELAWQLLAVSRRQVLQPDAVDLNALLKRRAAAVPAPVFVELALDENLEPVLADAAQLERAVQALIDNAVEAMPNGGALTLRTARAEARPRNGEAAAPEAAPLARLEVADTGPGIAPEVRERLFEPFVSTKHKESNSGLGLAAVYGFVRQSGGAVSVVSRPGEGSTFCILLPRAEASRAESSAVVAPPPFAPLAPIAPLAPVAPVAPVAGEPCVLVVEDEPALRQLAVSTLTRSGYRTLAAGDAAAASAQSTANPGRIALLLSDVVLPGMNGRELAAMLLAEQPQMQVVLMSGYTQDALGPDGILPPGFGFLQKPFTLGVLRRTVAEKLASPAAAAAGSHF